MKIQVKLLVIVLLAMSGFLFSCHTKEEKVISAFSKNDSSLIEKNMIGSQLDSTRGNEIAKVLTRGGVANSVFVSGNDVYVGGSINGVATVWKNGVPTALTGDGMRLINSIFISGDNIYVAGSEEVSGGCKVATVWKNGVATALTNVSKNGDANSVFVSGDDIYVAGFEWKSDCEKGFSNSLIAKVWKNGKATTLTDNGNANSVFVSGSDVYVAGYEEYNNKNIPTVWKNGIAISLSKGGDDNSGRTNSVFVSRDEVYLAGYHLGYTSSMNMATVWKGRMHTALGKGEGDSSKANSVFVSGSDVYVVGSDKNVPTVWKNGIATTLTDVTIEGDAKSVFVSENNVYVTGYIHKSQDKNFWTVPMVWKNGKATALTDGKNTK